MSEGQEEVHGVVAGDCPSCGEKIPENTLVCPSCGYKRQFNQEQYDILVRYSEAGDISKWNAWRERNFGQKLLLEAAQLPQANLQGADLVRANLQGAEFGCWANLQGARLEKADLQGADLSMAKLQGADFTDAILQGADLRRAHLQGARLWKANLQGARLFGADLQRAVLFGAILQGAWLEEANLADADLSYTDLRGVRAALARVDGGILLEAKQVDDATDFTGVGLEGARMSPALRAQLEYNIRRKGWEAWYTDHRCMGVFAWLFWGSSDYGRSTRRILAWLVVFSVGFAALYYVWGLIDYPGIVDNLFEVDNAKVRWQHVPMRAFYFSAVTMTTLGFGDIHADSSSHWGHVFLPVQVFLGYIMLGALITRFAIMFQGTEVPWVKPREKRPARTQKPRKTRAKTNEAKQ